MRGGQCVSVRYTHYQWRRRGGLGWTLLLEVAPEIDTNPTSFYRGRGRRVVGPVKVFLTPCDCVSFVAVVKL